jgi:hypothetical protein
MVLSDMVCGCVRSCVEECCGNYCSCGEHDRKENMTEMSVGYLCVCTPIP